MSRAREFWLVGAVQLVGRLAMLAGAIWLLGWLVRLVGKVG